MVNDFSTAPYRLSLYYVVLSATASHILSNTKDESERH